MLDKSNNIPIYNNLFNKNNNINDLQYGNYINDTYNKDNNNNMSFSITKKLNDIVLNKTLSQSKNKKEDEYNAMKTLNIDIEKEINNLNMGLHGKNDKIYNNIDKMHITDTANDLYTLQNIITPQYTNQLNKTIT